MDQRDGADDYFVSLPPSPPAADLPRPPEEATSGRRASGPSVVSLVAVLAGAVAIVAVVVAGLVVPAVGPAPPAGDGLAVADLDPGPSREQPVQPPDTSEAGYEVWARNDDGSPVRWNPCEPIRWVLNTGSAPSGTELDLMRAVGEVTAATGLRFHYLGTTTEQPRRERPPYQPDRYGSDGWAPVLVAWASPDDTDVPLGHLDRGVSIPVAVGDGDQDTFVTGQVVFNPDRPLVSGFADRRTSWGATILHELAHTIGLDHVGDPAQLMYTYPGEGPARFAAGDRRGLRELGAGGCREVPDPVDVDVTYVEDFGGP